MPLGILAHLAPGAPAQHRERNDDHAAAEDGRGAQALAEDEPVGDGDDEDGQQGGYGAQHGARQRDQHQEATRERRVHDDADPEPEGRLARRELERLPAEPVQDRQRDPQHEEREEPDAGPERVREDRAPHRRDALRRAGPPLVEHLVQAVEHAARADYHVPEEAGAGGRGGGRRVTLVVGGAVFRVAVRDDQNTGDGNEHGERFVEAHALT